MRQASTTMSCVAEAKATSRATAPMLRQAGPEPDHGHADQPGGHEQLGEHHPAATAAEPAEHRRVDAIDDGRPQELEGIGEPDPGEEPDRLERRPLVAEPVAERVPGRNGSPDEKPSASITATLGWRSDPRTSRLRLRVCAVVAVIRSWFQSTALGSARLQASRHPLMSAWRRARAIRPRWAGPPTAPPQHKPGRPPTFHRRWWGLSLLTRARL